MFKLKGGSNPRAGVDFDRLSAAGPVNLNGAGLSVRLLKEFQTPPDGTRFRIINNTSDKPLIGTFDGLPNSGSFLTVQRADGKRLLFSIDYRVGINHNDVDLVFEGVVGRIDNGPRA